MVELVELGAGQHDVALSVHRDDLLRVFAHEEVLAEDYVVEDAANAEDVRDRLRFCGHVFDVYDFRSHVAGSAATYKEVVRVVSDRGQSEVDDDGLLAEDDVVWLEVAVDDVLACHLRKSAQNALHDELTFVDRVLGEVVESPADGVSFHVLQGKVYRILRLVNPLNLHEVRMVEHLGDLDLVHKCFLAVLLRKSCLLAKGLDGYLLLILEVDPQVDGCKVSLSQPLLRLEQLMEVELVHDIFEFNLPLL